MGEDNQEHSVSLEFVNMIDIIEMSVLIADDMPNMVTTLRGMMKFLNYGKRFIPAKDGEEAWRILQKEPVDLAILDYNMPMMNGAELLSRIREDKKLRDLPVIMVTAQAIRDFVAEAAESEIDAYILKPATVKVLGDKVLNVIESANSPSPMVFHPKEARAYEDLGDLDAAVSETKLAIDANPSSSRPLRELGYYHYKKGDLKESKIWLTKAAKMNPLDVFAFHYLGELYANVNDIDMASKYFEKAMNISPRHVSRAVSFGTTLLEKNMPGEAIQVFEKALSLAKNNMKLREEVAHRCVKKGAKEYGATLLESVLRKEPHRQDLALQLGTTLTELGQYPKALTFLKRTEKEDKNNLAVKMVIAKAYLGLGKAIRAEKALKELLKSDPDNIEALDLMRQCI